MLQNEALIWTQILVLSDIMQRNMPEIKNSAQRSKDIQSIFCYLHKYIYQPKNLKANVEVEKKEIVLRKLDFLFEDKYYAEDLKIPNELIKGFKYYCVEDPEFAKAVNSKNKTMCMFLIIQLASNYNKIRFSDANTE